MSDPVLEAAQALTPLLAAGADGVAAEMTRQAGQSAASATRRVIDAIRGSLGGGETSEETVAAALRAELEKGTVTQADIQHTVKVLGAAGDNRGIQVKGKAYIGNSIHVEGDFHG